MRRLLMVVAVGLVGILTGCDQLSADTARGLAATLDAMGGPGPATARVTPRDDGDPSAVEEEMLGLINRARTDPVGEAQRMEVDLNEGLSPGTLGTQRRVPVTMNATLLAAARAHAHDMLINGYFAHEDKQGHTPFDRILALGYYYLTAGENLAVEGTTRPISAEATIGRLHRELFVDKGIAHRGHRVVMLQDSYREVGVGGEVGRYKQGSTTFNALMVDCDFGSRSSPTLFVTGMVYADRNGDGRYSAGEGLSHVTVTLDGASYVTRGAGGYGFALRTGGRYELSFHDGDRGLDARSTINVGRDTAWVDYVYHQGFVTH